MSPGPNPHTCIHSPRVLATPGGDATAAGRLLVKLSRTDRAELAADDLLPQTCLAPHLVEFMLRYHV